MASYSHCSSAAVELSAHQVRLNGCSAVCNQSSDNHDNGLSCKKFISPLSAEETQAPPGCTIIQDIDIHIVEAGYDTITGKELSDVNSKNALTACYSSFIMDDGKSDLTSVSCTAGYIGCSVDEPHSECGTVVNHDRETQFDKLLCDNQTECLTEVVSNSLTNELYSGSGESNHILEELTSSCDESCMSVSSVSDEIVGANTKNAQMNQDVGDKTSETITCHEIKTMGIADRTHFLIIETDSIDVAELSGVEKFVISAVDRLATDRNQLSTEERNSDVVQKSVVTVTKTDESVLKSPIPNISQTAVPHTDLVSKPASPSLSHTKLVGVPLLSIPQSDYHVLEKQGEFSMLPVSSSVADDNHSTLLLPDQSKQQVFILQPRQSSPVVVSDNVLEKPENSSQSGSSCGQDAIPKYHLTIPIDPSLVDSLTLKILCDDEDDDGENDNLKNGLPASCSPRRPGGVSFTSDSAGASFKAFPPDIFDTASLSSLDTPLETNDLESAGGFVEINLHSSGGSDRLDQSTDASQMAGNPKASGFSGFLSRFSRKTAVAAVEPAPGWKLFGKVPPKEVPVRTPDDISREFKVKTSQHSAQTHPTQEDARFTLGKSHEQMDSNESHRKSNAEVSTPSEKNEIRNTIQEVIRRTDREVPSTTALILEQRPGGLPLKSQEEAMRHQKMYNEMVEAARRKEKSDLKQRKKQRELRMKREEQMSNALQTWNLQILPNWETAKGSKKAQELWWIGLPPSIRGKVWKLAIGNDLNVTSELYEICLVRAQDKLKVLHDADSDSISSMNESPGNRESSVELIKLDVSRTFPQLCIFQQGGPYHQILQGLLGAYACYRPDVGYVQGMSFLAAVLLLNMDAVDTFICFANLLNKPCEVAFFRLDESLMKAYFETYEMFFQENLPQLFVHFKGLQLNPDIYIIDWMFTLFTKSLPLDVASRVWDVFCRDGEEFLFRTALGILRMYRDILIRLDFIHLAQFLTRLPDNISGEELFDNIAQIRMTIEKQRFTHVLAVQRDRER